MSTQEKINELEARQLALSNIMASSDAHASKCTKLGLSFAETYPDDLAAYEAAREEYNTNEESLAALYAKRAEEEADVEHERPEEE